MKANDKTYFFECFDQKRYKKPNACCFSKNNCNDQVILRGPIGPTGPMGPRGATRATGPSGGPTGSTGQQVQPVQPGRQEQLVLLVEL